MKTKVIKYNCCEGLTDYTQLELKEDYLVIRNKEGSSEADIVLSVENTKSLVETLKEHFG